MARKALVALVAVLAACSGGDDKVDPASRTFQYGAPIAPSVDEAYAAEAGEESASDGAALHGAVAGDPVAAGSSIMSLPDRMAADAWSQSSFALQASGLSRTVATLGGPAAVITSGYDDPSCVSVAPGLVTYSGCTVSLDTLTIQVDGRITVTGATLAWDLDTRMTDADPEFSMSVTVDVTGGLTFGPGDVTGRARSDSRASFSAPGTPSVRAAYTTVADLDLDFARDPFCVTGGTLELRRVWTERPSGAPAEGQYADQGLLFSWQGCGTVLVAHSL